MILSRFSSVLALGLVAALAATAATGCRGNKSPAPPVHPNRNMDFQQKFTAQEKNSWFADGRAMRQPVANTVAQGFLRDDDHFENGRDDDGRLVDALPEQLTLDAALLERGEARYDIYCTPCHAKTGYGDGIVVKRGLLVIPPSYHAPRLQAMPLGYLYHVIKNGKGAMMGYAAQIPPADRWAIAAWVRVLQASHRVTLADIPADQQQNLE